MKLRMVSRLIVLTLVIAVGSIIFIREKLTAGASSPALSGTQLGGVKAPSFALRDQNGQMVSLGSLRGKPVVLTFMYTSSPSVCPREADQIAQVMRALGSHASNVAWIAISVDPGRDTPSDARAFLSAHGLAGRMHYLLGSATELSAVWRAYGISPVASPGQPETVQYATGIYLLDASGNEQVYLDSSVSSTVLTTDLRTLTGR